MNIHFLFKKIPSVIVALALAGSTAALASASSIVSFTSNIVPLTDTYPPLVTPLTFQAFDPSLGTLTGVNLLATGNFLLGFVASNFSDTLTETYADGIATASIEITGPAGLAIFVTASTAPQANSVAPNGRDIFSYPLLTATSGFSPSDLNDYKGLSLVTLLFQGATLGVSGTALSGNDLGFNASGKAGGFVQVNYTYDVPAAPEPATFLLIGSALSGIALIRRRHRS